MMHRSQSKYPEQSSQTASLKIRGGSASSSSTVRHGLANVVFDNGPFWQYQSVIAGLNLVGFVISLATGSHLHLDLFGTGAFAAAALPKLLGGADTVLRVKLSSAAVVAWGSKLAGFLLFRAFKVGNDTRLESTLSTTSGTAIFWTISLVWGVICSLPHSLGITSSAPGNPIALKIGTALYVMGLATETLADLQKWTFKQASPGKFCNVGLWSISQHPNFFGNLMLWAGIFIMNADALVDPVGPGGDLWTRVWSYRRLAAACLGPWFMWTLFSGQASGTLTNTVELANSKYSNDPVYQEYIANVPKIIPNPFKK